MPITTDDFNYPLPPSLIAQSPPPLRTMSRLLVVPPDDTPPSERRFADIGGILRAGDLLVANDTRVVPARLRARKVSGGKVEVLLERVLDDATALVQLRANKPLTPPLTLTVGDAQLSVTERRGEFFVVDCGGEPSALFADHGVTPLPPYIDRAPSPADIDRYQTVYATTDGAVAAPTAGLHFDRALIKKLRDAGVGWATVTLHIGAATFRPVRAADPAEHLMHREWMTVDRRAVDAVARARAAGGRVVAVGTTVVRALETAARQNPGGELKPFTGDTDLFILPGHRFAVTDALVTNFHLPRSTLLMLVCAFAGADKIIRAYHHAVAADFRFYSYGDAMFAERAGRRRL